MSLISSNPCTLGGQGVIFDPQQVLGSYVCSTVGTYAYSPRKGYPYLWPYGGPSYGLTVVLAMALLPMEM